MNKRGHGDHQSGIHSTVTHPELLQVSEIH